MILRGMLVEGNGYGEVLVGVGTVEKVECIVFPVAWGEYHYHRAHVRNFKGEVISIAEDRLQQVRTAAG